MAQKTLIYAAVARGTTILAEHTEYTGNFTDVARRCLEKLPATNNKFVYNCDGYTFDYLVFNGFAYFVVAVESLSREITTACLERIKDDFSRRYGGGKAATATANSLNKDFGSKLKEHMRYCMQHPEEISKLAKVQNQVSEVKEVMMQNIEKIYKAIAFLRSQGNMYWTVMRKLMCLSTRPKISVPRRRLLEEQEGR